MTRINVCPECKTEVKEPFYVNVIQDKRLPNDFHYFYQCPKCKRVFVEVN
jgi:uncharacterized protein with PIN domain